MEPQIRILKFGSSVLRSKADLSTAVQEIYREWRRGAAVVAVVPAFGNTADDLLKRAEQLGLPPSPGAVAALLATGESAASALLTLALQRSGLPATLLSAGAPSDRVRHALRDSIVVISADPSHPPLRVALLGCGTVGGGVLERLLARPDLFHVTGVAVRDRERARRSGLPRRLLVAGPLALVEGEADVIVELLGGREPARRAVTRALKLGKSVVTANKALLAEEIDSLERLAARGGARLLYSASVGGALPALEAVRRYAGRIRAISGVLNGTCNSVLDRLAAGDSFETAVAAARTAGFAEADPTLDLDGSDAAQKLSLLVREAFGVTPRWDTIPRLGIAGVDHAALESATRRGQIVRLVASAERTSAGLRASVRPVEVPRSHPFAHTSGAGNALRIETTDGEVIDLSAQGAGRWPTCEAVLADLYDLAAARALTPIPSPASPPDLPGRGAPPPIGPWEESVPLARGGGVVGRERGIEGVRAQEGAA
jgi:homoserine dehydrogenase